MASRSIFRSAFCNFCVFYIYYSFVCTLTVVHLIERINANQISMNPPSHESAEDPAAGLFPVTNVTTEVEKTVNLRCPINVVGDEIVAWLRLRDGHILTVGEYTYTHDARFQVIHEIASNDWILQIKYPGVDDAGFYECRVMRSPPMSASFRLSVSAPKVDILEGRALYVKAGSTINLTCIITDSQSRPNYVFWYHDTKVLTYDTAKVSVSLENGEENNTISRLLVPDAELHDSGNYTCSPSNAESASIDVYVLSGERPHAMHAKGAE